MDMHYTFEEFKMAYNLDKDMSNKEVIDYILDSFAGDYLGNDGENIYMRD